MKKLILIIIFMFMFTFSVNASELSFSFEEVDGVYSLIVIDDNKVISYEDAEKKYNLNRFTKFKVDGKDLYFDYGVPCSKDEYIIGYEGELVDNKANFTDNSYRVTNTDEFIDAIKDIYSKKKHGVYKLLYSKYEYKNFNLDEINKYYQENLLTPLDKNMYKFDEYGINFPLRFVPVIGEEETVINYTNLVTSNEELKLLEEFKEYFVTLFDDTSDIYKINAVFNFIKKNSKFVSDNSYEYLIDAYISPYDVLFEHKMVCIGASTTFQYLMEALGVESYIVDRVVAVDPSKNLFVTEHTYNVVKLDDAWYVVDIVEDKFLTSKVITDNYSLDIALSDVDALIPGGINNLDDEAILKKIDEIKNKKQIVKEEKEDNEIKGNKKEEIKKEEINKKTNNEKDDKALVYTVAIIILLIIGFIIFFATV